MYELFISPKKLYQGCLLAAITHAVAVGMYPELDYEHSWDTINYCMNDSEGCRGTITFHRDCVIGVFQGVYGTKSETDPSVFFDGAPETILQIAQNEAQQYVLCEEDGIVKPVITTAFWGSWEKLFSAHPMNELMKHGGHIIQTQLLPFAEAMEIWREYYDLDKRQMDLVSRLFSLKMKANEQPITLQKEDVQALYGETDECLASLKELGMIVPHE